MISTAMTNDIPSFYPTIKAKEGKRINWILICGLSFPKDEVVPQILY